MKYGTNYEDVSDELFKTKQKISALLDNGRLFLPNTRHKEVGGHKEGAYRGIRQQAMDCIWFVFDRLKYVIDVHAECNIQDAIVQIVQCRRHFVSEIQEKIGSRLLENNAVIGIYNKDE